MAAFQVIFIIALLFVFDIMSVPLQLKDNGPSNKIRVRRSSVTVPPECKNGAKFYFQTRMHCHIKNSNYNEELQLCLVDICPVPGMPDGKKGFIYIAHKQFLYQFYSATTSRDIVVCPTVITQATTMRQPTTSNSTTPTPTPTPTTGPTPVSTKGS
ncbi:uncharacterized protein LOC124454610 [Xenia sp. Carnegie-2017]|uniref:uncharacterized protein LOC124454610 n=1 Tax=Xenia sp. Carnegie-2017 TaxID=2897299 RepID=UPI001F047293|nr:uncharacterized protein LOC124454610 [Xenia sp. Carnegie-2017]